MRAEIENVELKSRRDVQEVTDPFGRRRGFVCGSWEYTAEIKLSCDREFWEALWKWCAERGVTGARAYLPEGVVPLPPAIDGGSYALSSTGKPRVLPAGTTKAALPRLLEEESGSTVIDGEFEDGDFETE